MAVICQSPMNATPGSIAIPGHTTLAFDALAAPDDRQVVVRYRIVDADCRIVFANGQKVVRVPYLVTSLGTTVRYSASFTCTAEGTEPPSFDIEATLFEDEVEQCTRHVNIVAPAYHCPAQAHTPAFAAAAGEDLFSDSELTGVDEATLRTESDPLAGPDPSCT